MQFWPLDCAHMCATQNLQISSINAQYFLAIVFRLITPFMNGSLTTYLGIYCLKFISKMCLYFLFVKVIVQTYIQLPLQQWAADNV